MTRVFRFIFRNWPLKLAAIVLATLLYAGLVLSQNALTWPGRVTIEVLNQPSSAFLVGTLPDVTNVRYFAPADAAARLSRDSFHATVDLSGINATSTSRYVNVKVNVTVSDPRVTILDFVPQQVQIQLDPVIRRVVPVQVDRGTVPSGLQANPPILDVQQVTAFGPSSVVRQVAAAEARVRIQPSGVDIDQSVDLVAVDARGDTLSPVEFDPPSVHVRIQVGSQLSTRTMPVNPIVTGTPSDGYNVTSVVANPPVVPVGGEVDVLAGLVKVDTAPISVSGASADLVRTVPLALPDNVTAAGSASVQVTISIRPQTGTRDFSVGVVLQGTDPNRTYTVGAASVIVTLGGTVAALDAFDPSIFSGTVDVTGLGEGTHTMPVHLSLPVGLSLVAVSPGSVIVDIGAVPTPAPSSSG